MTSGASASRLHRVFRVVSVALLATAIVLTIPSRRSAEAAGSSHDVEYVARMVTLFLDRPPTAEEVAQATAGSLTTTEARARLVENLAHSPTWLSTSVQRLYRDTLGRSADSGGLTYWTGILRAQTLSLTAVTAHFYASSEFFATLGGGDLASWVDVLYQRLLGRNADAGGRRYWADQARVIGRARVARAFIGSLEARRAQVTDRYRVVLGRAPDRGGLDHWAEVLRRQSTVRLDIHLAASSESYGPLEPGQVVVPPPPLLLVERLAHNGTTDRIVTVRSSSWSSTTADLVAWRRTAVGWRRDLGPWTAHLGRNGFGRPETRREGAGTTPTGRYGFGTGFGIAANPGYRLGWFVVDARDYWVSQVGHPQYNTHQRGPTDPASAPWSQAEHLIDHPVAYRYAASIRFNTPPTGPYGSAIFLHVSTGGPTAGCVSVAQASLLDLLGWIDAGTQIVMAPDGVIDGL